MKNYIHIIIGIIFGMQFGIFADLILGILTGSVLNSSFHQKSPEYVIDRLFSPAATVFASIVATVGVAIVIANQNRLSEISRKNKLIAAKSVFYLTLAKIDATCKHYTLKAFHGNKYKSNEPPVLSDGEMEKINIVIENSSQNIQNSLASLFLMYQIALGKYNGFVQNRESYKPLNGKSMPDKMMEVIIHLISLRALIQCYYLYGIDGDFDKFEPDLKNANGLFCMMICTFAEYDDNYTPTRAEEDLRKYILDNDCGFLKKDYLEELIQKIKAVRDL